MRLRSAVAAAYSPTQNPREILKPLLKQRTGAERIFERMALEPNSDKDELLKRLKEHFRNLETLLADDDYLVIEVLPESRKAVVGLIRVLLDWLRSHNRAYMMLRFPDGSTWELEGGRATVKRSILKILLGRISVGHRLLVSVSPRPENGIRQEGSLGATDRTVHLIDAQEISQLASSDTPRLYPVWYATNRRLINRIRLVKRMVDGREAGRS